MRFSHRLRHRPSCSMSLTDGAEMPVKSSISMPLSCALLMSRPLSEHSIAWRWRGRRGARWNKRSFAASMASKSAGRGRVAIVVDPCVALVAQAAESEKRIFKNFGDRWTTLGTGLARTGTNTALPACHALPPIRQSASVGGLRRIVVMVLIRPVNVNRVVPALWVVAARKGGLPDV